jgi:hypothetical protein
MARMSKASSSYLISDFGLYQGTTFSRAEPLTAEIWASAPAKTSLRAKAQVIVRRFCGTSEVSAREPLSSLQDSDQFLPHPALRLRLRAGLGYSAPTHPNPRKRGANRGPGRRLFFALPIPPPKHNVSSHALTEACPDTNRNSYDL